MKKFIIMAVISLGLGFSISKIFFPLEKETSQNNVLINKSYSIKKPLVPKESKIEEVAIKKNIDKKAEITKTILKSSGIFQIDPSEGDRVLERIDDVIRESPEDSFLVIKNLFDSGVLEGDPILKGSLLVKAASIKGKEDQVREMALGAIFSENVPKEKELKELRTEEEINKEYSDDPKVLGIAQYYDAFLATTIADEDQILNKSLEIIEAHPNIKIKRMVAKKYLETFPNNGMVFWELLKNRNIQLIPPGSKITIKGIIYQ